MGEGMIRWLSILWDPWQAVGSAVPVPDESLDADALLKRLATVLRQRVVHGHAGTQQSLLKGQGLDFVNLREYQGGDDIRKIDWNVFARTFQPHVREYREEKEQVVWLALDLTPSMGFGSGALTKAQRALELAGLLGLLACRSNHRLGFYGFHQGGYVLLPPQKGHDHLQHGMARLMSVALAPATAPPEAGSEEGLASHAMALSRVVGKHATVFFLSDFWDGLEGSTAWQKALGALSRHSQVLACWIEDPREGDPFVGEGLLPLVDPETGKTAWLDRGDVALQKQYQALWAQDREARRRALSRVGSVIPVSTEADLSQVLWGVMQSVSQETRV